MADRMTIKGSSGDLSVAVWDRPDPERIVLLAHGYGEHIGRYEHVAAAFADRGAAVYGPDHLGHGESAGEQVLVTSFEDIVDDLHLVIELARERHPGRPVVLIGHSMGGLIATRYAQRYGGLDALVLSGPSIGLSVAIREQLAAPEPPPNEPIDVAVLSRDPAVGEAYTNDPLVYHGAWKPETLGAFVAADEAIEAGEGFGDLPTYYLHGEADQLVPLALAQPWVHRPAGSEFTERIVPEARHEVFNEIDKDETIRQVADWIERVASR